MAGGLTDFAYEGLRRVVYGDGATFVPVCPTCGRFVKADATCWFKNDQLAKPNATCKRCGRVEMLFEGWV